MTVKEVIKKLNIVFCDVFDDDDIVINETTTGDSIEEWDSLGHITLILAVEKSFKIRFSTAEIAEMKKPGNNVGTFAQLVLDKQQSNVQ